MSARNLDFLTARPIAHRGLHDHRRGIIENSRAAARAAIAAGYAIECDVQPTKDGDLVVFHDDTLERLTLMSGRVADHTGAALSRLALKDGGENIPLFDDFLNTVAGRTPLIVEIKSAFDGDMAGARLTARKLAAYAGPVVIESFDPAIIACLRREASALGAAHLPLGIVGEARYDTPDWAVLSEPQRRAMTHFLHYAQTRPDFLSWSVADFPHAIPALLRDALHLPVTTWTVREPAQAAQAAAFADQIVFEGFTP